MFETDLPPAVILMQVVDVLLSKKQTQDNEVNSVLAAMKKEEVGYIAVHELLSAVQSTALAEYTVLACIEKINPQRGSISDIDALNWALIYARFGITKETAEGLIEVTARMGWWKHIERHTVDLLGLNRGVTVEEIKLLMDSYARAYQPDEKQHTALRAMARAAAGSAEEQEHLLRRIDDIHERVATESTESDDCH